MTIELGRKYKDKITGFSGVATGWVTYITGCNQVLLAPPADKGDPRWVDEQRLDQVGIGIIRIENEANQGFDTAAPIR